MLNMLTRKLYEYVPEQSGLTDVLESVSQRPVKVQRVAKFQQRNHKHLLREVAKHENKTKNTQTRTTTTAAAD